MTVYELTKAQIDSCTAAARETDDEEVRLVLRDIAGELRGIIGEMSVEIAESEVAA
jgi:hypothetical protein